REPPSSAAEGQQRYALLLDEAPHRRDDPRGTGRRRKRGEEGVARGIAVAMRVEIAAHAVAEGLIADEARDHRDDVAVLAIGDRIEGGVDLVAGLDRLAHGPAGGERVEVHRAEAAFKSAGADVQCRL